MKPGNRSCTRTSQADVASGCHGANSYRIKMVLADEKVTVRIRCEPFLSNQKGLFLISTKDERKDRANRSGEKSFRRARD